MVLDHVFSVSGPISAYTRIWRLFCFQNDSDVSCRVVLFVFESIYVVLSLDTLRR